MQNGARFGVVKNIVNFGAGDILEIYDYGSEKTVYYPFNRHHVPKVDLQKRRLELCIHEEVLAASE